MTLRIMTLSVKELSIVAFFIKTLNLMTISLPTLSVTLDIKTLMPIVGVNLVKLFLSKFTHSFGKLDRFRATRKNLLVLKRDFLLVLT
jgi:hypothetical protein